MPAVNVSPPGRRRRVRAAIQPALWLSALLLLLDGGPLGAQPPAESAVPASPPAASLTMEQAVVLALRSSPEIEGMAAEQRMATAQTRMARAMTRPQVSANTYVGTGTMGNILATAPGVMPVNYNVVPRLPFGAQNLTLMLPLYTGGRLSGAVRAAGARETAAGAEADEMRLQVALMVREAYLQVLLAGEMVRVAAARRDAATAMVQIAQAQFEVGKGIQAAVQRAEAERADAERMVLAAGNDREKMLLELRAAMGIALETPLMLTDTLPLPAPTGNLDDFLRQARETRPALRARDARIAEARARSRAARGARQPQIYGMAMADGFSSREMGRGSGYTAAVTLSLPLGDGGQRRAEVEEARAAEERAAAERRTAELAVEREVWSAWLDRQTAVRSVQAAEAGLVAASAAYDIIVLRVQNQKSIQVEQLEALAARTQAGAAVAQAHFDLAVAAARQRRAVGQE